jgi:hypothetical protein
VSDENEQTVGEWIAALAPDSRVVVAPNGQEQAGTIERIGRVMVMVRLDETGERIGRYRNELFTHFSDGRTPDGKLP